MLNDIHNRDINDGKVPPTGNTNQFDFGGKNFVKAKHNVFLNEIDFIIFIFVDIFKELNE